jgi:feruloyl-CoA synthase
MSSIETSSSLNFRPRPFGPKGADLRQGSDGSLILTSKITLDGVARHACDWLEHGAREFPDRTMLAQRGPTGDWIRLSYAEAWRRSSAIATALLQRGMGQAQPLAILSGNSVAHALMTFAAMIAGVPAAPISPSYSLLQQGMGRLAEIIDILRPKLVFVETGSAFARARALPRLAQVEWVSSDGGAGTTALGELEASEADAALWAAFAGQGPDNVAKILFTSGSTGSPKGVLNTQRMLCSAARAASLLFPAVDEPPVQVDWLPWHHTMGGNANLLGILRDGGTLYIDDGRPTPEAFARTLRNLKEISPTSALNVPLGWQLLAEALGEDSELRQNFFRRLRVMSSAGASLPRDTFVRLQDLAERTVGQRIAFVGSYGTTETGPGISSTHWAGAGLGDIGSPVPGLEVKLNATGDRYEVRVRGPQVTPGYLNQPEATAAAFDSEGFYKTGDAVTFVDPDDPSEGLRFAGRLSENFKLTNGSWVLTGDLRAAILSVTAPLVQEVVVAGHDRDDIRLLVWANGATTGAEGRLEDPAVYQELCDRIAAAIEAHNGKCMSQTLRIAAFRIVRDPPSLAEGEVTDKGNVNQRRVLAHREALVAQLYSTTVSPEVRFFRAIAKFW